MKTWLKYLAFVRVGGVRGLTERGELYGRMLFIPMILGVFHALWNVVGEVGMPTASAPNALVWYLAATEWIVLSPPLIYVEVQDDVRRGDIACALPRPVSYVGAMYCQALGLLAVRASALGVGCAACALAFTRQLPELGALAWFVPFGIVAMALITACYLLLGLVAFWMDDVSPLYWIWQKAMFLLGGLMLPLEFYPGWFRQLGAFTPFPALLAGPASLLTGQLAGPFALTLASKLAAWALAVAFASQLLFTRATRRLQVNGG
jgi:ABC-2 type transport system permease protein